MSIDLRLGREIICSSSAPLNLSGLNASLLKILKFALLNSLLELLNALISSVLSF